MSNFRSGPTILWRDYATMAAALRFWQSTVFRECGGDLDQFKATAKQMQAEHFTLHEPLDYAELETLCGKVNLWRQG